MKHLLLTAASAALIGGAHGSVAADGLPKPLEFARYEALTSRSPFAVATVDDAAPLPASNSAKDWYIANVVRTPEGDLVTLAASTDTNFKHNLSTKEPVNGISILKIEWRTKPKANKP